jgi:hypothetical protein
VDKHVESRKETDGKSQVIDDHSEVGQEDGQVINRFEYKVA